MTIEQHLPIIYLLITLFGLLFVGLSVSVQSLKDEIKELKGWKKTPK